jgi:hypothetical protein
MSSDVAPKRRRITSALSFILSTALYPENLNPFDFGSVELMAGNEQQALDILSESEDFAQQLRGERPSRPPA